MQEALNKYRDEKLKLELELTQLQEQHEDLSKKYGANTEQLRIELERASELDY